MLLLETAENYPERFWLTYDQEASTKASLLSMCTPLEEKNPVFIAKSEKKLSVQEIQSFDIIESDMMSFVSKRLADILVDYPEDVEIFEAKIVIAGEIVPGFFALNVLNKKQCIDLEASDYRPILDGYPEEGLRFYSIKTYPVHTNCVLHTGSSSDSSSDTSNTQGSVLHVSRKSFHVQNTDVCPTYVPTHRFLSNTCLCHHNFKITGTDISVS